MNNLILTQNESLTMSSREIADLTGKQVSHVHRDFKAMSVALDFPNDTFNKLLMPSPNVDLGFTYETDDQGRIHSINLNRELTLTLISGYNIKLRNAIIKRWQELESKQQPQLPQNYLQALEHLIEKEKLLIEQAPKVEYFNKVLDTTNGFTTTEIASELKMSAIKLNRTLKEMTVQRKIGGRWVLTAGNLGNGYTSERTHVDDGGTSRHSMLWTEKGRKFIHDLFAGE